MSNYTGAVPDTRRKADWRDQAACREEDAEMFFASELTAAGKQDVEQAKAVCRRCPSAIDCLGFALDERIDYGIFGGLNEQERASLRRAATRRRLTPEAAAKKAEQARQPAKPRTLRSIVDDNTTPVYGGHLAWTGKKQIHFRGQTFTPKQLAFTLDRGHAPDGRVTSECGNNACVLPAHLADTEERARCGTRSGYRRHLANGETSCDPCLEANADADRLLRNTGTTKALV